ncbi:DUF396-domain-containing protein [Viridothelium virens]|uniref:DUF396-domain-containing protein n=1 Tax=Viridothelium virens TaxID=1048519 RepID=A0A6A6HLZ0_VIRVR|nr:DUF396-domain-containing protein [Viridothelium virens]
MWILPLLGYIGVILGFSFLTLSIASGLYYLSELVEEHTVIAKKILTYLIYSVVVVQILLVLVDKFPLGLTAVGVASHGVYSLNLRRFPIVKLTDPTFLISCILVLLNHYLWFRHFSAHPSPPSSRYSNPSSSSYTSSSIYGPDELPPTFTDVASYFGLCVWLVPFALFVSLSAGENVLPSMGSEYATGEGSSFVSAGKEPGKGPGQGREGMAKAVVNGIREWVGETGELMGFWKGERTKKVF